MLLRNHLHFWYLWVPINIALSSVLGNILVTDLTEVQPNSAPVPLLSPLPFNPVTLSHASMGGGGGGSPRDEIETAPAIVGLFYAPRSSPLAKGGGGMKTYILHYLLFGANIRFVRKQAVV